MRTRLLTLLLPLLASLGFAPSALGVVPATASISTAHDTSAATAGQGFLSWVTVDASSVLHQHSFTLTPSPGFTITNVGSPQGNAQGTPSQSGASWIVPVNLDHESATWPVDVTAAPTAGAAVPFQISSAGTPDVSPVPAITVSPVSVTYGSPSRVLFPGAVGATALSQVQVAAADGAPPILTSTVSVLPGTPAGVGATTVNTKTSGTSVITADASATPGTNAIGPGTVVKVGNVVVAATVTPAVLTLANRPRLAIAGLPAGMMVGDTATVTVSISHDSGVSLSAVPVTLSAQGLSLDAASWSLALPLPGVGGVGTSSATATVTATSPGTGTLTAKYSLGGDTTQTATTSISARPPAPQPTSQQAVTIGFRALSPSPFGRRSHRLGFKGELVNTAGGSPAPLSAAWCSSTVFGLVLRLEQKLPGTKKWRKIAGKATIKPKFSGGRCTIAWGRGKKLGTRNNGVKLRYQLRVTPKRSVSGFATPNVTTLTLGVLNIG